MEDKLIIFFYNSYQEFREDKNTTQITEEDYQEYFTQNTIEKILVGEPARIMREFPFIDSVEIKMPKYATEIKRDLLNEFLGFRIEQTSVFDGTWRSQFSDVYIYNKTKRKQFITEFVNIDKEDQ
jgi:hypothetical protein